MAFFNCKNLKEINLEDTKVFEINEKAFNKCTGLNTISFPNTLKRLAYASFKDTGITNLDLSNTSIKELVDCAFQDNFSLLSVILPDCIEELKFKTFDGCEKLNKIDLKHIITIDLSALNNTNIKNLYLPSSLVSLYINGNEKPPLESITYTTLSKTDIKELTNFLRIYYPYIKIKCKNIDYLLDEKKSFKEINNFYKEIANMNTSKERE